MSSTSPEVKSSFVRLSRDVSDNSPMKRSRGRPKGCGKLQILASIGGEFAASAGGSFRPRAFTILPGEDAVETLQSFTTKPKQGVCVLAANGEVSRIRIRPSNAEMVLEGSYDIIKLSGSYLCHKVGKNLNMTGGLSIQLAGPDGQLYAGHVVGSIIAKEPIQLIIGTFKQNVISDFLKRKRPSPAIGRDSVASNPKFAAEDDNFTATDAVPLQTICREEEPDFAVNENAGVDENALALQVWSPPYFGC